jgi:deoxyribodipyrimidine photo-lyase
LKHPQEAVSNNAIPKALLDATTNIQAIDQAIQNFYQTGYIHNHVRMYIAAIVCNFGQSHWRLPAQWMYYHLLDADWASNALSWQWVAGSNANKKYIANQENINRYCFTQQTNTFLDKSYETLSSMQVPDILSDTFALELKTALPLNETITIDDALPTCIYNFYNLDPNWKKEDKANRVLLLEPSHFEQYPISAKTIDFIIDAGQTNIANLKVYVGEFNDLQKDYKLGEIYFKEHPLNNHYKGTEEPREWMFDVTGYFPSFFSFWKKCKKQLYS